MIRITLRPKAAHSSQPKTPLTPRQSLVARLAAVGLAELYGGGVTL